MAFFSGSWRKWKMDKEMLGIIYALICLVLTAFNDFIFKMFARKERSKGLFCTIIGIFWMAALSWTLRNCGNIDWKSTIFWGCVSGVMSAGGNLLLIEGMSRQSAGLCSLIYRLNLVPTVIAAGIFLGEIPSMTQYIGIVLALFAIILFQWGNSGGGSDSNKWAVQAIVMVITTNGEHYVHVAMQKIQFLDQMMISKNICNLLNQCHILLVTHYIIGVI